MLISVCCQFSCFYTRATSHKAMQIKTDLVIASVCRLSIILIKSATHISQVFLYNYGFTQNLADSLRNKKMISLDLMSYQCQNNNITVSAITSGLI